MTPRPLLRAAAAWAGGLVACAAAAQSTPVLPAALQDALHSAGPQAAQFIDLWRLTLAICTVVLVAVLVALGAALWRAPRAGPDTPADTAAPHAPERGLVRSVAIATGASVVLLLVLLGASLVTDRAMAGLPRDDALKVQVIGHQWWWELRYEDAEVSRRFATANELHVPVGRTIELTLKADDVIHSLWVPSLVGKKDLIPGRTTTLAFRADRPGRYRGNCAEFCGAQHAWMALLVVAEPPAAYEAWADAQRQPARAPADARARRGEQVFMQGTCAMCHAIQGTDASAQRAPDLTHLASRQTLAAGRLPRTDAALAAWIRDPQGFKPGNRMPGHDLPAGDLDALVAYLQGLQ